MRGQGHYYCPRCRHAVYASRGGCGTCMTPLIELMLLDDAFGQGMAYPDQISFDPFDGQIAFNIPGTDLAIEPDGRVDIETPFGDVPLQDDPFGGW